MSSTRAVSAPSPRVVVGPDLAAVHVTPRRHYGRWVISAVVLVLLVELGHSVARNPAWEWHRFGHYFTLDVVLQGVLTTLKVTALSAVIGLAAGILLAIARLSRNALLGGLSWVYIWFFRSMPLNVLLVILFNTAYFFPTLGLRIPFGPLLLSHQAVSFSPLAWGVIGLSLNEAAFAAELIRGGLLGVDPGQVEAAHALGLPPLRRLRRVVLPQALRSIVPGYTNQLVGLVKASSLVYYVSLVDLFGIVSQLSSTNPQDLVPILVVGVAWYLVLAAVLTVLQYYVERHFARGSARALPPTPLQRLVGAVRGLRLRLSAGGAR
jgi:polar amino acid transport system permease protein